MTLIGHGEAVASLRSAMADGRLHHAWLLAGPPGVGKATFAVAAARRLLADAAGPAIAGERLDVPADHPAARLIDAGSHPDYRRLARLEREKGGLARNIGVDQVRGLLPMFATTPSLSPRRAIVVDAADDLERSAANALLKNLEEPPAGTIFLLVSHAPGRLLPTIRSRCRLLRFGRLSDTEIRAVLEEALPGTPPSEIETLVRAGEGAPGRAIGYAGLDVAALDRAVDLLATQGDPHRARAASLAKSLAAKAAQPRYDLFLERAPAAIAGTAKRRSGRALADAVALWEKARGLAESARALSFEPQAVVFELAGMLAALAPATRPDS